MGRLKKDSGYKFLWHKAFMASDLPVTAKAVGAVMWDYSSGSGENSHPGVKKIAESLHISTKTVDRQLSILRESGWLLRTSEANGHPSRKWADVYCLEIVGHSAATVGHSSVIEGQECPTNRVLTTDPKHHSDDDASGAAQAQPAAEFENYIEDLTAVEASTAQGMWDSGSALPAIRNKINSDRRSIPVAPPTASASLHDPWGVFEQDENPFILDADEWQQRSAS